MENVKLIENELNNRDEWELENGCVNYSLELIGNNNNLQLMIKCEDEVYENYIIELEINDMSIKSMLQTIIQFFYENEINFRQNYINKNKSFNLRKIKSLSLWSARGKQDKVQKINEEMIERHNTTIKFKAELEIYNDYVRDMYSCLNGLCPFWKVWDIREYLISKFDENNIKNIEVQFTEDYLIICKYENGELYKRVEVKVDNYSKKHSVYNEVIEQLKRADCCFTNDMKELDKMSYADMLIRLEQLKREKAELMKFESILNMNIGGVKI